jgi:hypothetical protein
MLGSNVICPTKWPAGNSATLVHCRFSISAVMTMRPSLPSPAERNWYSNSRVFASAGTSTWNANTSTVSRTHFSRSPLALITSPARASTRPSGRWVPRQPFGIEQRQRAAPHRDRLLDAENMAPDVGRIDRKPDRARIRRILWRGDCARQGQWRRRRLCQRDARPKRRTRRSSPQTTICDDSFWHPLALQEHVCYPPIIL